MTFSAGTMAHRPDRSRSRSGTRGARPVAEVSSGLSREGSYVNSDGSILIPSDSEEDICCLAGMGGKQLWYLRLWGSEAPVICAIVRVERLYFSEPTMGPD